MKDTSIHVQKAAKHVMHLIFERIAIGMTEQDVLALAESEFINLGIKRFWYYGVAALTLVGKRTTLSISGRNYQPTSTIINDGDLVTIDLSPELDGEWGDYARSIVVTANQNYLDEFPLGPIGEGLKIERQLHQELIQFARPSTTFHEIFEYMNQRISELGYINLDFKGNLGHSIEYALDRRCYIENGNQTKLGEVNRFTFEPHIRESNGALGFKRENIYRFFNDVLVEV